MCKKISRCASVVLFLAIAPVIYGQLQSLQTEKLRLLYYDKTHEYIIPHLARCFENALQFHDRVFEYNPGTQTTVFLEDFGDYGHGGATPLPYNRISVGIEPFSYVYETKLANERMNWLMNHETTHIVASDKPAGSDKFFRSLFFGKVSATEENPISIFYSYLTTPRFYSPRWYHEGIAVFMETWMAGGLGRVLGAYDEMVFRTMVRDSSYFYDIVGLESEGTTIDFQVGVNSYLYGTRFMSYLAYHYGPEKLLAWINRTKGSKKYFSSQFKKVYGNSLDEEWSSWIDWEKKWQRANLDSIRLNPTTPYRPISNRPVGSVSRTYFDTKNRKLYTGIRYPGQVAHIAAIDVDSGSIRKICEVKGSALFYVTSLTYDPTSGTLFYTTDNNGWRDLNAVDVMTGNSRTLLKDFRTGDLAFNPKDKSIWGVRHYIGISTLVRIPYPYKEWNQIYSFPYGKDIFDIDVSPDGSMVIAALTEINGSQRLIQMSTKKLLNGENNYNVLFDFEESTPANFTFSRDGTYAFGSSYYSGVSNIYRYDFKTQEMDIISNCESGFFRPIPVSTDSLIVFRYTGKGFQPVMIPNRIPEQVSAIKFLGNEIAKRHSVVRTWEAGSPASIDIDSLTTFRGPYNTISSIRLGSGYPIVEGYKDFVALGWRFNFLDRLGLSGLDLNLSYSPDTDLPNDERFHAGFKFKHWNFRLEGNYNASDFYDLFGPTKRSRKGYSLGIGYMKTILYDQPKTVDLDISVTGYGDLERLPDFQNVAATFDKLFIAKASLNYQYFRKSLGAVDDEKGIRWELSSYNNYVNSKFFPRFYTNLDYGFALPINHSSIWFRSSAGYSFGDRDDELANPFANFYFGAFGNNWVDHLSEKRYRDYYSFPGFEINEIEGKNYGKIMMEWNLPPLRFRRFGFPSLYFNWARLALFSSAITTNLDDSDLQKTFFNLGAQLDFKVVLFSHLSTTLSLGFASGVRENESIKDADTEFMFSLKIL